MQLPFRISAGRSLAIAALAATLALPALGTAQAAPRQLDAQCGGPYTVAAGAPLTISVPAPFAGVLTYNWGFGDGTGDDHNPTSHVYAAPGQYDLSLRVTSSRLDTATCATTVTVTGGDTSTPTAGPSQIAVSGDCGGTFTVETGSPLALQAAVPFDGVVTYVWQFGDGASDDHNPTAHVYAAAGSYALDVRVTSSTLETATCETTVNVVDPSQTAEMS